MAQELEVNINESSFWTSNNEVCPAQLDENPENITQMDSYVADASQNDNFLSSWTEDLPHLAGWKGSYVQIDDFNTQDSSLNAQNDKDIQKNKMIVPLYERGYPDFIGEGIFNDDEEVKILSPQQAEQALDLPRLAGQVSFQKGAQEGDIPMDFSAMSRNDNESTQDSSLNAQNKKSPLKTELQENLDLPNLIISEIYRLWTTERIEITNLSDNDFSWKLSLSWAKSSLYTKNLDIPSYDSIILADKAEIWLINDEILAVNNAWFNIADSDEISVSLIYSWNEIDTFNVDKSVVSNNQIPTSKPRPTFQKIYDNWRKIQITTEADSHNITWSFIANPWKIITKNWNPWIWNWPTDYPYNSENPWTWEQTWSWNNSWIWDETWTWDITWAWDITWEDTDFNLILSEVFYDDDDEWIEIFNIWNGDFFWDLILSWNIFSNDKTYTYQNIQIPAHDFLIIADSNEMFNFDWDVNILLNDGDFPQFSIPDDQEIQISLLLSWQQVDWFFAHQYRVNKRDDYGVSFHKILTQSWPIITRSVSNEDVNLSDDTYNYANPWVLYTYADEIVDYGISPEDSPQDDSSIADCSNVHEDIMTISEVFRWWSRYDPYVEFSIHDDIMYDYDSLLLSWSLLVQPIIIDLDRETETYDREKLQKNTRLILTTKAWALTEAGLITIVYHPDLEFNYYSWELELYGIDGQSRQVLDIVKITTWWLEKSNYHDGYVHSCGDNMDNIDNFSPGFDESALKYFSTTSQYNEKIVEKVKYMWWWGGCSCPSKTELCWISSWNVVQTWNSVQTWNVVSSWTNVKDPESDTPMDPSEQTPQNDENTQDSSLHSEWQDVKIVSLEPKTPESITLQSFLTYDIDFKNHNYYLKTSTATTKKYIDWILYSNTIDTFSKSFWFVDAWACVYLYSWDSKLDSYCYSSQKTEKEQKEEKSEPFNPSDYQLSITHIDYDPEWSDSWNESITIKSNSSKSLDLSKIKMKVNATNKKLTWILEPYSTTTLKWNFWFPNSTKDNSDVVVILFYDNHIFSTYTYNPNKPKVEIPDWAVKVYSVIDGDTFRYRKEDWILQSVRLLGVDAPESNTARYRTTECFWKEAKNYLTNLIKNQYVTLEFDSNSAQSDAYGRMLAYVYLDWKLVNETLIAEWYAKEYTYKTAYSQQSVFKQAEENAKKSEKWLRSSAICGKSIEEEPEAWGIDYEKLSIKISSVIYDPDGTDSWNEIVQLNVDNSQISTVSSIDFSDNFSLTIFPRSEYSTWTTKTKKLSEFWNFDFSESPEITLKWNFWLPNNRATCVSLNQWSYTFDTRCYNPNGPLSEEELVLSWQVSSSLPNVKIQSIIPNPSWKDSWKEEISLLRTPSQDFPESLNLLDLSPDFSLLINWKTKKKLVWNLVPNQKITIKWSFSLPNSASCVSLLYKWEELDKFCYWKASDGMKFNSNNTLVREIPAEELAIVKKIKLVRQWDKLCVSYNKTQFSCKKIPNSTTEKNKKLLSMQNSYITQIQKYLKNNYSMLYYNSELKEYFDLYSLAKKTIKSWNYQFERNGKMIAVNDIDTLFSEKYELDSKDYFISKNISSALLQFQDKYTNSLVEKSDLDFLSLAQ